jgi:hypothetical protein
MADTSRLQRWREGKRQHGMKAVTIWLTTEEELRLKDLALQWHCSPSAVMQRALAQVITSTAAQNSIPPDTLQIHVLAQEDLATLQAEVTALQAELTAMQTAIATATDTVTETVTATLVQGLPGLVRQLVEGLALEALGLPVTDTNGNPTETLPSESHAVTRPGRVYKSEPGHSLVTEPAPQGKRGQMRAQILALLTDHPEGLSAEEIRVYLRPERPLGDTLQGMRRQGKVHTRGRGKDMRYFVE